MHWINHIRISGILMPFLDMNMKTALTGRRVEEWKNRELLKAYLFGDNE